MCAICFKSVFDEYISMSYPYEDNKSYMGNMLTWMGVYLGISLAISFVIPFPASLLAIFTAIIGIDYLRARYIMKKMGIDNIRQMFGALSGPQFGYQSLKYFCMSCVTEHGETLCPKCG
jgi:hypothetical protein